MSVCVFTPRHGPTRRRPVDATVVPFPNKSALAERYAVRALRDLSAALRQRDALQAQGRHGDAFRASLTLPLPEARRALAGLPAGAAIRLYCEAFPEACRREASGAVRRLQRVA